MTDIGDTIQAKSDQLNADDLLAGPIVITINRVVVKGKGDDQPVEIHYDGGEGRPYKPSKGMRRTLVHLWGGESGNYVGRSLKLYRDPTVQWGGEPIGGIRIGAASHITGPQSLYLQVKKGKKAQHTVEVLQVARQQPERTIDDARTAIANAADAAALEAVWRSKAMAPFRDQLGDLLNARKAELAGAREPEPEPANTDGYDGI